jgi:hypothetical protein
MGHLRIVTATGKADLPYARMVNWILVFFTKESLNAVPSCNRGASLDTVHSSHSEVLATKTAFFFSSYFFFTTTSVGVFTIVPMQCCQLFGHRCFT